MDEVRRHGDFTTAVLHEHIQLYAVISDTSTNNVKFVGNPKLNPDDWDTFANGIEEYLAMLLGNGGVPLTYMIRDDTLRPDIDPATTSQDIRLFWNAIFTGPSFRRDQNCVWGYLAQRVIATADWNVIKTYQSTSNTRQDWLDL